MIRADELTSIATTLRQRSQNQRAVLDEYFKAGGSLTSAEALNKLAVEIADYLDILGSRVRLMGIIRDELTAIKTAFADPRRTEMLARSICNI